jgi:hypothetical protein
MQAHAATARSALDDLGGEPRINIRASTSHQHLASTSHTIFRGNV